MLEFLQNYGIWIALIGGMFLMHRLGIGCCGGHTHGQDHGHRETPKPELKTEDAEAAGKKEPGARVAAGPRRGGCH